MKEYMFIAGTGKYWQVFEKECSDALAAGWIAQGGICATRDEEGDMYYVQAFVR